MKKLLLSTIAAAAAFAAAPAAQAATYLPGSPQFQVNGDINNGTVSATIGSKGIAEGAFTDLFQFTLDQVGTGSGSLATSTSFLNSVTDLDLLSVFVNGMAATKSVSADGLSEFFSLSGVPIAFGQLNTIEINGFSRGNGSYGGNVTFTPNSVPEAGTWAMMIIGFGAVGSAMRYRRKQTKVAFA